MPSTNNKNKPISLVKVYRVAPIPLVHLHLNSTIDKQTKNVPILFQTLPNKI